MKEVQKFIWLLIVLAIITSLFPLFRDVFLARVYGTADISAYAQANWKMISIGITFFQNIAAALWLRHVAIKSHVSALSWSLFGLIFGLMAIVIFYLVRLNEKIET